MNDTSYGMRLLLVLFLCGVAQLDASGGLTISLKFGGPEAYLASLNACCNGDIAKLKGVRDDHLALLRIVHKTREHPIRSIADADELLDEIDLVRSLSPTFLRERDELTRQIKSFKSKEGKKEEGKKKE